MAGCLAASQDMPTPSSGNRLVRWSACSGEDTSKKKLEMTEWFSGSAGLYVKRGSNEGHWLPFRSSAHSRCAWRGRGARRGDSHRHQQPNERVLDVFGMWLVHRQRGHLSNGQPEFR